MVSSDEISKKLHNKRMGIPEHDELDSKSVNKNSIAKRCMNCGVENDDYAQFCQECGLKLDPLDKISEDESLAIIISNSNALLLGTNSSIVATVGIPGIWYPFIIVGFLCGLLPGLIVLLLANHHRNQKIKELDNLKAEEILSNNKKNFLLHHNQVQEVNIKKSWNGVRKIDILTSSRHHKFSVARPNYKENFDTVFEKVFPDKINFT